jgi:hypothetical protein
LNMYAVCVRSAGWIHAWVGLATGTFPPTIFIV